MSSTASQHKGILLFAHGARDQRWAEPFLAVRAAVQKAQPEVPLQLAFLELMQPDLASAITSLVDAGCKQIQVVPLFLGQGSHLRRDLPALVEAQRLLHPDVTLSVSQVAGESQAVLAALTNYCLAELGVGLPTPEN